MQKRLIAAYGTEEDRVKARKIAEKLDISQSRLIIDMIRQRYTELFGSSNAGSE